MTVALTRLDLSRDEITPALLALDSWTPPADVPGPLHSGDLGWALRNDDLVTHLWLDGRNPVAVGFHDGPVMRVTLAPGQAQEPLLDDVEKLVGDGEAWCDGLTALTTRGWQQETEPWLRLAIPASAVAAGDVPDLEAADVADRVAVQRAGFERSTFTVQRWQTMRGSLAGDRCVEVLVRTHGGEAASAVTGWLAGPGRCALIEPMATHPDHRGQGYGRAALARVCAALVQRGASGVAVLTPASNVAAVAVYRSAGFTVAGEQRDVYRAAVPQS